MLAHTLPPPRAARLPGAHTRATRPCAGRSRPSIVRACGLGGYAGTHLFPDALLLRPPPRCLDPHTPFHPCPAAHRRPHSVSGFLPPCPRNLLPRTHWRARGMQSPAAAIQGSNGAGRAQPRPRAIVALPTAPLRAQLSFGKFRREPAGRPFGRYFAPGRTSQERVARQHPCAPPPAVQRASGWARPVHVPFGSHTARSAGRTRHMGTRADPRSHAAHRLRSARGHITRQLACNVHSLTSVTRRAAHAPDTRRSARTAPPAHSAHTAARAPIPPRFRSLSLPSQGPFHPSLTLLASLSVTHALSSLARQRPRIHRARSSSATAHTHPRSRPHSARGSHPHRHPLPRDHAHRQARISAQRTAPKGASPSAQPASLAATGGIAFAFFSSAY